MIGYLRRFRHNCEAAGSNMYGSAQADNTLIASGAGRRTSYVYTQLFLVTTFFMKVIHRARLKYDQVSVLPVKCMSMKLVWYISFFIIAAIFNALNTSLCHDAFTYCVTAWLSYFRTQFL